MFNFAYFCSNAVYIAFKIEQNKTTVGYAKINKHICKNQNLLTQLEIDIFEQLKYDISFNNISFYWEFSGTAPDQKSI